MRTDDLRIARSHPLLTPAILDDAGRRIRQGGSGIKGLMVESHLAAGKQDPHQQPLTYGQSITDACLGFEDTRAALLRLAETIG